MQYSRFAEVFLHLLIAGQLSRKNLPGVPSREIQQADAALPVELRRTLTELHRA